MNTASPEGRRSRRRFLAYLIAASTLGGLLASAAPATAVTVPISGSQYVGIKYYGAAYRDTHPKNSDLIIIDNSDGGGGPPFYAGMTRGSGVSSYATTQSDIFGSWTYFTNKSNGGVSNAPGTFYLRIEIVGGCGGNCLPVNWTGRLNYNNPVTTGER